MSTSLADYTSKDFDKIGKSETEKGISELRKNIVERAQHIVHDIFPRKVLKLNEIFQVSKLFFFSIGLKYKFYNNNFLS